MGKAVGDETKAKLYMQAAHEMMVRASKSRQDRVISFISVTG